MRRVVVHSHGRINENSEGGQAGELRVTRASADDTPAEDYTEIPGRRYEPSNTSDEAGARIL